MTLVELYARITNDHLPLRVRQMLPDPLGYQVAGSGDPMAPSEWKQFEKVGEDQTETIKVNKI